MNNIKKQTDDEIRAEASKKISDEEFLRQVEAGREVMQEHQDVLRRLAGTGDLPRGKQS